ncbi:hypothetical protein MKW98_008440, partial [Papaver atlanticum]
PTVAGVDVTPPPSSATVLSTGNGNSIMQGALIEILPNSKASCMTALIQLWLPSYQGLPKKPLIWFHQELNLIACKALPTQILWDGKPHVLWPVSCSSFLFHCDPELMRATASDVQLLGEEKAKCMIQTAFYHESRN